MKQQRNTDPRLMARHWADLVVTDVAYAQKLILRLREDTRAIRIQYTVFGALLGGFGDRGYSSRRLVVLVPRRQLHQEPHTSRFGHVS
jgi:hypothetical protein